MSEREQFRSEAPSCVVESWQDDNGGVWLKSVDGDLVLVPKRHLRRFRELFVKWEKRE